ncbi:Uncharacterised protein [Ewingella americana]|uniref:Uncharacterized protein n=2 Tax=Ewingella americana TaxID=41202 RepID=A0A085G0Z2_EWIA3|nr:hypothetical protein GEAM_4238 [Ewingella americana ATCC 33852]STS10759.1 Uncharacterised protein [Ewingella americana]
MPAICRWLPPFPHELSSIAQYPFVDGVTHALALILKPFDDGIPVNDNALGYQLNHRTANLTSYECRTLFFP